MARLIWDQNAHTKYELGVDRGVLYPASGLGEPWNGLVSVQENPTGGEDRKRYLDGVNVGSRRTATDFEGVLEAYTYPQSFHDDVLSQRRAKPFGLSYRTQTEDSYKLHIVYNVLLGTSGLVYDQDLGAPFSWNFTTLPIAVPLMRPTAHLVVEASIAYPETTLALENVLYGSDERVASLPDFAGILKIFEDNSILQIIDHGDGTWTASGPDEVVSMLDATTFQIDWPSAVYISSDTYTVHSL